MLSAAYIAGFFDGEGCIHGYMAQGYAPGRKLPQLRVTIANTNLKVLEEIQKVFAGSICERGRKKANWSRSWVLTLGNRQSLLLLKALVPFLLVKRKEAEVAIELGSRSRPGTGSTPLPEEEWNIRVDLISQLHNLKTRGGKNGDGANPS